VADIQNTYVNSLEVFASKTDPNLLINAPSGQNCLKYFNGRNANFWGYTPFESII
jgi:hypothetical protein